MTAHDFIGLSVDGVVLWRQQTNVPAGVMDVNITETRVAFRGAGALMVYDVNAKETTSLDLAGRAPAWSPSGHQLAYEENDRVYVYDVASKKIREIGLGQEPSWTPDGGALAVRSGPESVDVVSIRNLQRNPLLRASRRISVPRWSPDGDWMMYTREGGKHWWSIDWTASSPSQIVVRHTDSENEVAVGEFYKANRGDYRWVASEGVCRIPLRKQ
jgi:Tol biopolymer transport system component